MASAVKEYRARWNAFDRAGWNDLDRTVQWREGDGERERGGETRDQDEAKPNSTLTLLSFA